MVCERHSFTCAIALLFLGNATRTNPFDNASCFLVSLLAGTCNFDAFTWLLLSGCQTPRFDRPTLGGKDEFVHVETCVAEEVIKDA